MVLALFGDTHELHREVEVPAGDILICIGDFTMFSKNLSTIEDFNEWLWEANDLAARVQHSNVKLKPMSYRELWAEWEIESPPAHLPYLRTRYDRIA